MKHELSALIADYKAGKVSAREVGDLLRDLRDQAGEPQPAGAFAYPLSEGQRGLWALQRAYPDMAAYNVPLCFRVSGLDVAAFQKACRALLVRHPVLTTVIGQDAGEPMQSVDPARALDFARIDLTGTADEGEALAVVERAGKRVFSLGGAAGHEGEGLFRVRVFDRPAGESLVLVVVHHIVFDGTSATLLMSTLFEEYEARVNGVPAKGRDTEGAAGFHDFVREEGRTLAARGAERLPYWRNRLAAPLPVLDLPADRPHTALADRFAGKTLVTDVPAELAARVAEFATAQRTFVSTAMLTAYAATLATYSGVGELVVGMPVNEREGDALARTVGLMINMVPVRVALPPDDPFDRLVARAQRDVADDLLHGYPFPALVRELGQDTPAGRSPVFQTAFVFQDVLDGIADADRPYRLVEELHQEGEYELSVEVWRSGAGYALYWKYQPELYSRAFVQELAARFVDVLAAVCDEPRTTVAALRQRGAERCVQDLVEDTARRTPDAVAVAGQEEVLTYEALSARSAALASCLVARGVRRGDLVSVLLDRSPDLVVTLLGILKAGAAYVPLDPELPAARLADIVADSGTRLIVTQARHEARARGLAEGRGAAAPALFVLDEERDALAAALGSGQPIAVPVTADDLAYVIYTSGSTGRPKGVMIPHRGFTNLLGSLRREPGMDATDTLFAVTTVSFDMAQVELLLPLVCGARVYVCDSPAIKDVDRLKERVARVRPSVMQATPAMWSMLFHSGWRNPEGVRIFCGGEALPRTLKEFFRDTGTEAWNLYGPTETTVYSTGGLVRHDRPTTIGRPVAHTRVHILDERMRPVPHGETGELCIAGKGLAKGYVNRPDLTAEKFVDHDLVPGGKLYRTGDLARWTEDGEIDYLGRKDYQVKIRGHRIELGDIEYHLGRHQDVAECVVVARGEDGAKQLVAYYMPAGAGARADSFKEHLRALLPAYMVPDFYVPLDAVPLTGSGKVDRTALMRREVSAAVPAPAPAARPERAAQPSRDVEREVLACWQEVLKVRDLTPSVSFFESGGNSLSAVVLADLIGRRLGVPFAAADLFKYATPAAVAAYVREQAPDHTEAARETQEPVAPAPTQEVEPESESERVSLPDDAVAVVGISCRFPDARDHWEFWENLKRGHASAGRWTEVELRAAGVPERVLHDPDFVPLRSGLDGKDEFDGAFFRLSPQHIELMDPQFRQVLLHAWKAVEDAGRDHKDIPDTGVYVSTGNHHYGAPDDTAETPAAVIEDPRQYLSWVMSQSGTVASMVSYQLGFGGPSMSVHSNCSSSLSALALAARAVQTGETDFALVAGASANSVDGLGYVHKAGLNLSGDGRVKAFDADADGMAGGEGVVALLIRRAADAVADGDHIYGLLRGIAVNNDGGDATGFYSPSVNGQSRLIRQVLDRTGIDPRTIGYVEAHGTGTKLGDPVEVAALTEAYRAFTDDTGYCGIGSVKTNLGHLDTAAGLAGAVKVLLSLYHGQLPPTLHYREPNPQLRLDASPFHVVDRLRDWPADGGPRRAAQSSIGLGGTNAHAVFEEYVPAGPARADDEGAPQLVPLSARTRDDLVRAATELRRHLTGPRAAALRLDDVAHTLRTGRVALAHRVVFVVRDLDRLASELDAFVRDPDGDDTARRFTGPAAGCATADADATRKHTARLARRLADGKLKKAAKAWARGAEADWSPLTGQRPVRRVSLPGYAFAPVVHPYPARAPQAATAAPRPDAAPGTPLTHPLLHENVPRLDGQRYRSFFSGAEFVLHDHVVDGKKLLPAVASLEMACTALRQALPETAGRRTVLKNVTWARPVVVDDGGRQVEFTLTRDETNPSGPLGFALLTDGEQLCVQGRATTDAAAPPPRVDLADLRDRLLLRPLAGEDVYAHIARAGVAYGPGFRLVHVLHRGERDGRREVLAELRLPAHLRATADAYALHPSFLDAAVHASLGLDPAFDSDTARKAAGGTTRVPFALDRLDAHAPFGGTMYAWVRPAANRSAAAERVLDIDLLDPAGRVCATLRGLAYRALAAPERQEPERRTETAHASQLRTLLPVWEPRHPAETPAPQSPRGAVLVLDADRRLRAELAVLHPGHQRVDLPDGASVDDIAGLIRTACTATEGRIARIVWVAPAETPAGMVRGQERGAVEVFRIVKALLALGHGTRDLAWSLYTFGTQAVRDPDPVAATHASVHGLAGSLAQEHTRWTVDLVDLPHPDSGDRVGDRLGEERHLTGVRPGTTVALRGGRWFSHELLPTTALELATGTYRHGGVYVVIGGAGGIGELWSRYMVDRYRATIVWIGRRPLADEVERCLADLAERARAAGAAAPSYVRADARDDESLRAAHARIKRDHPRIDGVVHSAIVLADKTLAHMDEDRFRASLAAKADVGVRVADVFGTEPLDFLLFFSSVESFVRAPGQANYAAGCTFKDALAHALNRRGATVAKAVNWGYWGVAGVVSDSFYRERMAAAGVDSLDPEEAFTALESFLAGEHGQVVLMRTFGDEALRGLALDEHQGRHRRALPSVRDAVVSAHRAPHGEVERLRRFLPDPRMRELTLNLLYVTLRDLGAARRDGAGHGVLPRYARWLEESHRLFAEAGPALAALDLDGAALWRQWRAERDDWQPNANQRAQVDLVESCLQALPDVLTGVRQGTEILFPDSSLSRVEGVYRGDPVVDYFNDRLSVLIADAVRAWGAAEPGRRLRVLEVGAGTGATSVKVLEALEPFGDRIAEYHYTDLSKAFLFRAEERLKPRYPHVTTGIFNAEHAPGPQGVDLGGFDVVVATNVLHATADISRTLRNVKATLREGGLLLLNEMSRNTLLAHVTFGLLDGWWRYRDAALRIPGSPVLCAESWREVLADEGFRTGVQPDTEAHALGQMVLVAESDGRFRTTDGPSAAQEPAVPRTTTAPDTAYASVVAAPGGDGEGELRTCTADYFERLLREALHLADGELDPAKDLHDYGLDSILVSGMNSAVARDFEDVSSTLFFELRTLDELVDHFVERRGPELRTLFDLHRAGPRGPRADVAHAPGGSLAERAVAYLTGLVAETLKLDPERLDADADLFDLGLDSILVVQLNNTLGRDFEDLGSTLFFDHSTVRDVAAYFATTHAARLAEVLGTATPAAPPTEEARPTPLTAAVAPAPAPEVRPRPEPHSGDIAVVGLAGRYPGADSPARLWENLARGESATAPYPADRWWCDWQDRERPWGGFLDDVASFDAAYFGIDEREAAAMDPQERLFIETAHGAVQDAGYTPATLAGHGRVGVFVGVMNATYNGRTAYSSIANRTSYLFDFQGPSVAVDTACSGSLTALHLAVQSLLSGDSACAVAGGVNLLLGTDHFDVLQEHGLLSSGERCRPFSEHADGFLAAEGVGAVVLRPLRDALAAGDHVYGVIKGSAVNSGGRTSRYSMPSLDAQRDVVTHALARAGVTPDTISYVEAHGTATLLGDALEISALSRAFAGDRPGQYCAVGSLKSNLGHCESASGIAGLTKVLMQLRHRALAPSVNAEELNTGIVFKQSPFHVQRELAPWHPVDADGRPLPRRAGISCFGAGGSNAHLIIEEYESMADDEARTAEACLVPLSAHTPDQLRTAAGQLAAHLGEAERERWPMPLRDIAYTLQTGRDELPVRLALVVRSTTELAAALAEFSASGVAGPGRYADLTDTDAGARASAVGGAVGDPYAAACGWLAGASVAWAELYAGRPPRRVSLPTYPFARRDHWYEPAGGERDQAGERASGTPVAARPEPHPAPCSEGIAHDVRAWLRAALAEELDGVAPHDVVTDREFAALGVSSMGLVRLSRRVRSELYADFASAALFEHRTVDALAAHLVDALPQVAHTLDEADEFVPHPLSEGQRGLWSLQQSASDASVYNVPLCFQVSGLDLPALRTAFDRVRTRHPLLAAVVRRDGDRLVFARAEAPRPAVTEHELTATDPDEVRAQLRAHAREPFDLENGPLCRLSVFHGGAPGTDARVLLNAHHLVLDGESAVVLVKDLLAAYRSAAEGAAPVPAAAAAPYAEFVADEVALLAGHEGTDRLAFWRERLAALPPVPAFPTDRPRSAPDRGRHGATEVLRLPVDLGDRVARFARERGVYPSAVFLAAHQVLLRQYTQQDDVVVGMPVSTRPGARFDGAVGHFVTMVPVRTRMSGRGTFTELCADVQGTLLDALAHVYPFGPLVRELGLSTADGSAPVFRHAFMYQDWHEDVTAGAPGVRYVEGIHQEGEYELVVEVIAPHATEDAYTVKAKYDPALFDAATVDRLLRQYAHLLESAPATDPLRRLDDCSAASPQELHTLTVEWNDTAVTQPDKHVHELIAEQAARTPDAVALVAGTESVTYARLDERTRRLAARLRRIGVRPGRLVAVHLKRSVDLVVALLATLRAGGAYIPLDPDYPRERIAHILDDAGPAVLLSHTALRGRLEDLAVPAGQRLLVLDDPDADPAAEEPSGGTPGAQDPAYVIYTSGSTGLPKGVVVPHRALTNFLCAMAKQPGLGAADRVLAVTTHSFDIAALELYLPLVTGAECHLSDPETARSGDRLAALIARVRPTVMQATPATWTMLLHAGWTNAEGLRVLCGGEALSQSLAERLTALGGEVWNLFGPTETTVWSTVARVEAGRRVTIGRPIDNTRVHILDKGGATAPVGVPGELCIAGDGLALGYLNKPELTAERFPADPFTPGGRLYRTGDLARRRADGAIECLGRIDSQVKVRGFRVEPGEIEHALTRHPAVRECAVVTRAEPATGATQLVAYWTGGDATARDLTGHLRRALPAYMVPAFVLPVDALPQTPNGKVDRLALARRPITLPDTPAPERSAASPTAVGTVRDSDVLAVWRDVLGVAGLRPTDAFLDAGGNSVLAVVLADRVAERFGVRFTSADVFGCVDAAGTAARLRADLGAAHRPGDDAAPAAGTPVADDAPRATASPAPEPSDRLDGAVAVIGVSVGLPGADDHRAFWRNLVAGTESVEVCTPDELRRVGVDEGLVQDPAHVPVRASMRGKGLFDHAFFQVSARDAELMDPQARQLLQHAWKAVEDAAYLPADIADAAVYMSTANSLYQAPVTGPGARRDSEALVGFLQAQPGTVPTTVSHRLGLRGPSLFVHSNCSSALAGLALACQGIQSGQTTHALVGGCAMYGEETVGYLYEEGMTLSPDGHCKPFAADARGMVGGEGAVVVLLKDARAAVRDGDHIHALVRGVGMNNDGARKAGYYAPSLTGQSELIASVLDRAGVRAESVKYLEAHGTGTVIGDPVEVNAVSEAFRRHTGATGFCGIGSVKANLGHLDAAAGLAGLVKSALVLSHRTVPPTINHEAPNPQIDFANSPFYVVDRLTPLSPADEQPLRAAVSSFGIGGTNVHAVLEEAPPRDGLGANIPGPHLVPLSARTPGALRRYARDLARHLTDEAAPVADVAFTFQVGRTALPCRAAFTAGTAAELVAALQDFAERPQPSTRAPAVLDVLDDEDRRALLDQWLAERRLDKVARLWEAGESVDWRRLYAEGPRPHRLSLPAYPFEEQHFWLRTDPPAPVEVASVVPRLFEEQWVARDAAAMADTDARRVVVVFLSDRAAQDAYRAATLRHAPGTRLVFVARTGSGTPEPVPADPTAVGYRVDPADERALARTLVAVAEAHGPLDALHYLWPTERADGRPPLRELADVGVLVRAVAATGDTVPDVLVAGHYDDAVGQAALDALIGYERSLSGPLPGTALRVVLHEGAANAGRWAELLLTEQHQEQKSAALYRGGQRHVCEVRSLADAAEHRTGALREGGTYLITGAFGGLGRRVAEHLARCYHANLVLLGRSPLSPTDETWAAGLGEHGGAVVCRRADVTDEDALVEALSTLPPALRAIDGVVHAAGTAQRLAVTDATRDDARRVLAAKVEGTLAVERALARTSAGRSAEFICLFSSSSATLGDFGSCDYAVANRFQSAYARALAERGERRFLAVGWPLWEDGGMGAAAQRAADHDHVTAILAASGQWPLGADTALAVLERLLAEPSDAAAPLVLHAPAERARALAERAVAPAPHRPRPAAPAAAGQDPAPARDSAVAHDRRRAALAGPVREVVAHVLKSPLDELDDDSGFHDLGLDSIRLTQLAHRLAERLGMQLQPTVLYDHPSVRRLTDHLADEPDVRLPESAEPAVVPEVPLPAPEAAPPVDPGTASAIAVIGMSGIFPGCRDVDAFWSALADGKDLVRELPPVRFGATATGDEGAPRPYRWMGSIDWADEFDAAFFEIAPKEARALDPRQRHLLQECWKALEDAALGAQELAGRKIGVFVGVEQGDYQLLGGSHGNLTSNHDGVLAARLSYFLDLKGPVLAVNTSCSSGLVALHQARASLLQGECDIAVVAAANFVLTPQALAAMDDAGMLSASGRCATFDQEADGMVPGEAVTALVLRPLAAAEAAGDPVHSVIAASGLNYDGRTNGITAPSGDAQRELLESVYERGGIDPAGIGYVVTHGTGTKLGDPVEVGALSAAFARHTDERGFCALTSTKTNVGHTFAASGLVGLVCLTEALRHRVIPPSLHCERDNEYIDWSASPFYVNEATKEWPAPRHGHRTGAVSAFGMSGTNAHVVVREYTGLPATAAPARPAYLLPVSAKTDTALEGIVDALLDRIASGALTDADLPRLSATLVTGRHHFRHRCSLVVGSLDEAAALWRGWRRARTAPADACFEGVVPRGFTERAQDADRLRDAAGSARDTGLDPAARRAALVEVARGYIAGHTIPIAVARPDGRPVTRLRLPAYPFARNRYWVRAEQQASAPVGLTAAEPVAAPAAPEPRKPVVLRDLADIPHRIDTTDGAAAPGAAKPQVALVPLTASAPARPASTQARGVTRDHDVLEDLKAAADLDFGGMVATLNRTGVMVERLIPYSQEFAAYAGESGGEALDLGCAYGVASIAALERGARVVALDMEQKHLDILGQRVNDEARERLSLRQGMLPDVDFEAGRFTAVHASRVMHFLAPDDFRLTLRKMRDWLVPGGKVFLSSDSPYFGYWASKAADYEARKSAGDQWPGFIDNVATHFEAAHVVGGPPLINAIDPDVFRRECEAAGFVVERTGFFGAVGVDRESYGAPAPDMEHVGIIARKPDEKVTAPTATATSADGSRIRYRTRGNGATALVLIHGLGCDASYWDRQLEHFADRYTVVAPDLAGHGGSGRTRQRWTVEAFAEDVVAVVEQEGLDDVVLVGHSLGGPVMLAAERLLGGRVRGLVGVDTLHNFEPKALSAEQLDRFVRTFSEQPVEARELFLDGARDDLVALVARTREETGADVVSAAFREMLTYLQDVPKHFDVPLVLINSTSWMPTNLTAARRYGVEVELVDGVGHFVMLEAPLTFNATLRRRLEQLASDVAAGQGGSGRGARTEGADS
ncbi:amino acid adenylation domain-containing protein [Streptomyces sp. NPDC007002]|uniref:amino acid adenylation domain-containing protein n=1 Tax=Streptomyces sp. NPDC007002 TaxID=3156910 RepID=UPI003455F03F